MAETDEQSKPRRPAEAVVRHGARSAAARLWPVALLVSAGIGLVVYGAAFHTQDVLVEQDLPAELVPPELPGFPGEQFPAMPAPPKTFTAPLAHSGPDLVREITYGGIARLEDGTLKRTYTGDPPSGCPT